MKTMNTVTAMTTEPLLADAQLAYIYDGSLEGLLSAVFQAFKNKEQPEEISVETNLQQSLLRVHVPVDTDIAKAERVQAGITRALGDQGYEDIKRVFLSDDSRKGGVILRFLQYALKQGQGSRTHLANASVAEFEAILLNVDREAHHILQFIRFAQLENGVFFARIHPRANVVPLIMGHFVARLNIQPFLIYDEVHDLAGVYDRTRWWLVETSEITLPDITKQEDDFQFLWQTFYDTIAIEERYNPNCRRNFMPKRFWGDLCEMIPPDLRRQRPQTSTPTAAAKANGKHRELDGPPASDRLSLHSGSYQD